MEQDGRKEDFAEKKHGMERLEGMKGFLQEDKEILLQERLMLMETDMSARDNLCSAIKKLTAGKKRTEGSGAYSLVIAFLRSSYITGSHEFYIACYEEKPFVEEEAEGVCCSMDFFFQGAEDDCAVLYKKLQKEYVRILDGEKEELRRWYMDGMYKKCGTLFGKFLKETRWRDGAESPEGEEFQREAAEEAAADVYYGEYMEGLERIGKYYFSSGFEIPQSGSMKYFEASVDKNYVPPLPIGGFGTIDKITLRKKRIYEMPQNLFFLTQDHMQTVFTDVITFPCFMVSGMVKDVMLSYNPFIKFARAVLYNRKRGTSAEYYIPFLGWEEAPEKEKIKGREALEIRNGDNSYVIMRMDLAESILRRGAVGIGLKEVSVI